MNATANYSIPTYANADPVDLETGYNAAMGIIDNQLKVNADAIANAGTAVFNPQPGDSILTVGDLARLKVTSNGIVYLPEA